MAGFRCRGRIVRGTVLVAAGCIAIAATANGSSAARPKCEQASGKTLVANERVRAFARGERLYVCSAGSRRMFMLGDYLNVCESSSGCSGVGVPALAGRYVAYVQVEQTRDAATSAIYVLDTKRARERRVWREGSLESRESVSLGGLVVTRLGAVAWIAVRRPTGVAGSDTRRVFKSDVGASREVLDEGQGIEIASLALSGSERTIYWANSGLPRSAPIK